MNPILQIYTVLTSFILNFIYFNWRSTQSMLERAWNYIKSKFSKNQEQRRINAVPFAVGSKQSQLRAQALPRTIFGLRQAQFNAEQSSQNPQFTLVIKQRVKLPEEEGVKQQQLQQYANLIDQVRQLTLKVEKLCVSDAKMKEADGNIVELHKKQSQSQVSTEISKKWIQDLKREYKDVIQTFMGLKYSKQKSQYPEITFQSFKEIKNYWKTKGRTNIDIKTTNFECVQKLTYRALGGLDYKQWLNDDIINIYLEMLEKRFAVNEDAGFKLLNSYFATNVLPKNQSQIQRFLKKKNFKQTDLLIMPINNRNHWYFAIYEGDQIVVYDSIKHPQQYYIENPLFKNALKFAKMFYGRDFTLRVRTDYPQQDNHYDCGVFLLMGIRDTLRSKQWSFHQGDIKFKRIQIAFQILRQTIIFTQ